MKINDNDMKASLNVPKLVQIQFAQFLNNLLEYSNDLTYFAINAFQTSSLRRVYMNTLQRYPNTCIPRTCTFYYNLDTEFDNFIQKIRLLCALVKRIFLDIRTARIHFPNSRMISLPAVRRSVDIFKCNINRLRDLKEMHTNIGHDLLLPNDQLFVALDLLLTDFELLSCELDSEIKFTDAMILHTIVKDIFLQYRIALTWIYPAVKYAAHRPIDVKKKEEIKESRSLTDDYHVENHCIKSNRSMKAHMKKLIKHIDHLKNDKLVNHMTKTKESDPNDSNNNCFSNNSKKRKQYSKDVLDITKATIEFNHYLYAKKLSVKGMINLNKI